MEEWKWQLANRVDSLDSLKEFINVTDEEAAAITSLEGKWGTTPHFARLMDPDDPTCPLRRQVIPSPAELHNHNNCRPFLTWKENRTFPPLCCPGI